MISHKVICKNMVLASILAVTAGAALAETAKKVHPVNCATAEGDLRAIAAEKSTPRINNWKVLRLSHPPGRYWGW